MTRLTELAGPWEQRLHGLVAELDVPGATLGVSQRGERVVLAAGSAGLRRPEPVTADTVFQLGSISKLYTATLLLSVAGLEILDRSVCELVPEAGWMDPAIEVGHLLTHSSGLGGDHFVDTGRGDDCLARYVDGMRALPNDVPGPPGHRYSYCNSGFAVLGRLIEVLCETDFDTALRERLLAPLGASATSTLPEDTILSPVATGHNRHGDGPLVADAQWNFARACGPLGGVCASAPDLLTFAELHLAGGRTSDGVELLAPGVAAEMRRRHLEAPPLSRPSARGLGFGIYDWPPAQLFGHDGETLGEIATLRLLPGSELALVVLTNAVPDGDRLTTELQEAVLADWGVHPPPPPARHHDPGFDTRPYVGRFRNLEGTAEVSRAPGGLRIVAHDTAEGLEDTTIVRRLAPIGDGAFVDPDGPDPRRVVRFDDPDDAGRMQSLFGGGRVARRVASE